jgi:fatty acid desaturase
MQTYSSDSSITSQIPSPTLAQRLGAGLARTARGDLLRQYPRRAIAIGAAWAAGYAGLAAWLAPSVGAAACACMAALLGLAVADFAAEVRS